MCHSHDIYRSYDIVSSFKNKSTENSDLKFILTIACSVGGGVLLLVILVAAVIKVYKVMTAGKHSPYYERGHRNNPPASNLVTKDEDILLQPQNMY